MSIPVNGGKGGHAEDVRIDFSKELKEDVVFWEDFAVIAKIIGLNWSRKEIKNWVECNWGKRTVTKFIAKVYIQPWAPHFDPTPLAIYSEPVWIWLYNLPIEYWSEEFWEKIGRTLGTLLEIDFDDVEDICKCARMKIAVVKKIPERITLVSEFGEWSQKVEIEKEISRCPRCGSKFHGEKECKMFIRRANKIFRKPLQAWRRKTEKKKKMVECQDKSLIAGFEQSPEKESIQMVSLQKVYVRE
ncbi:hypothetical protein SUGI_1195050 [Cryptomeria japonica]|nr:hypothetical protein SUGI_1195050 [Cryptomeria japonica]